jgi:hypothetical protein
MVSSIILTIPTLGGIFSALPSSPITLLLQVTVMPAETKIFFKTNFFSNQNQSIIPSPKGTVLSLTTISTNFQELGLDEKDTPRETQRRLFCY